MEHITTSEAIPTAEETPTLPLELLESLQCRAGRLLQEFRSYQSHLRSRQLSKHVEVRIFRRGVEAEHRNLDTIAKRDHAQDQNHDSLGPIEAKDYDAKRLQALRSSNLPFHEAVWATAKQCSGIRALGKRLYWDDGAKDAAKENSQMGNDGHTSRRKKLNNALVDIVANDGALWIKVSIVTAKRLVFEMAKEGWEGYVDGSESDDSDDDQSSPGARDQAGKLEVVRLAEDLKVASRATRVKYQHPQVRFVLPRIHEGQEEHIDAVISDIRGTGAVVLCGEQCDIDLNVHSESSDSRENLDVDRMLPSSGSPTLTSTLNIDCTILLALISDISHIKRPNLPPSPTNSSGMYHTAILKQIESEEESPLLPSELYPMIIERQLVCTELAAQRMREIVVTMGTKSEMARAGVLLGEGDYRDRTIEDLKEAWQSLSCHPLPVAVILPIKVEDFTFLPLPSRTTDHSPTPDPAHTDAATETPHLAHRLSKSMKLSRINASVFIYAWQHDIVTVTSNRVVAAGIERHLNELLDEDERTFTDDSKSRDVFVGPKMYVIETARSLVGKEKSNGLRP